MFNISRFYVVNVKIMYIMFETCYYSYHKDSLLIDFKHTQNLALIATGEVKVNEKLLSYKYLTHSCWLKVQIEQT